MGYHDMLMVAVVPLYEEYAGSLAAEEAIGEPHGAQRQLDWLIGACKAVAAVFGIDSSTVMSDAEAVHTGALGY
jgi:hypothetical protein